MASNNQKPFHFRRIVVVAVSVTLVALGWFVYRIVTDGPGPWLGFRHDTGLNWPHEARIVRSTDDHGGFQGEGEFSLIFEANRATIREWLAGAAPWGEWHRGPVPGEIGSHCNFGGDGVSWGGRVGGPMSYLGDEKLVQLLSSDQVWYSARERCDASIRWHNGDLLVLDPLEGRVWFSSWDF